MRKPSPLFQAFLQEVVNDQFQRINPYPDTRLDEDTYLTHLACCGCAQNEPHSPDCPWVALDKDRMDILEELRLMFD